VVAAIVTPASVVLGLISAYAIARSPAHLRGGALGLYSVPLVVPWLVTGVAGLLFFNALGLQGSLATVSVMQVVVTFPLVTLILYARIVGMDVSVEEAGLDLGSGRIGVLLRIVLPQLVTPLIVGAVFSCISSLGNFVVTFFVSGYTSTLPIWGYSELRHAENLPMVNASSTLMLAVNGLLFLVLLLLSRRDKEGVSAWF
jgi:ABC-type spermidine/putrescine transport system permease subunit II